MGGLEQPEEADSGDQKNQKEKRDLRGKSENWDACEEAKVRALQVTAPGRPDFSKRKFLGKGHKRMEFVSFSRGIMDPLGFHAAGDVLDSPFLNQEKIIAILLPGMHSPWSLCSCSLSLPSHCLREKQEVNQKQEPGEMARL